MKYGLIGSHLGHSYSKEIHAALGEYKYELTEIEPSDLKTFLKKRKFKGINVTIPYKQETMKYLNSVSQQAKRIGSVNTVVKRFGRLKGCNTDYYGMLALAKRIGIDAKGKKALILGTGGTSATAKVVLADMGCAEILTVSRTDKGDITYEQAVNEHSDAQIIFNTTPVGMFPETHACPIEPAAFPKLEAVLDVIYNPLRTELVQKAQKLGIPAEGGLYMLVEQAVRSAELFPGVKKPSVSTDEVYRKMLLRKQNIVLIGMPSSGKSITGKALSAGLKRLCFDTDKLVSKEIGMPIALYIGKNGEKAFREYERRAIVNASLRTGCIISTGGGAVLDEDNIIDLKKNGRIYFLDRSVDKLRPSNDRPLSATREGLERLYAERYPLYQAAADVSVLMNDSVNDNAMMIAEEFFKK